MGAVVTLLFAAFVLAAFGFAPAAMWLLAAAGAALLLWALWGVARLLSPPSRR